MHATINAVVSVYAYPHAILVCSRHVLPVFCELRCKGKAAAGLIQLHRSIASAAFTASYPRNRSLVCAPGLPLYHLDLLRHMLPHMNRAKDPLPSQSRRFHELRGLVRRASTRSLRETAMRNLDGSPRRLILPTEVCERIMDFVAEPPPNENYYIRYHFTWALQTLGACALTCRAWKYRAQLYLFHVIRIDCSLRPNGGINEIVALLNGNAALRFRVRLLVAKGGRRDEPSTLHLLPLKLPQDMYGLSTLPIRDDRLHCPAGIFPALRQFTSITELSLSNVTFDSVTDVRRMISSFSALEYLRLRHLNWFQEQPANHLPRLYPPCCIRLSRLYISAGRVWLLDSRSVYLI